MHYHGPGFAGGEVKTIVYQSYRTHDVPAWLPRCMDSVRTWARAQGFEYRFYDDELFAFAPDWYRERARHDVLLVSDLARLLVARRLLADGYERTVWIDADVLVFAPDAFRIATSENDQYTFCRETWLGVNGVDFSISHGVNNAVSVFVRGNSALEFLIDCALRIVRASPDVHPQHVSTGFLSALAKVMPLPLRDDVAMISPAMHDDFAHDCDDALRSYARAHGARSAAANLAGSFRNRTHDGVTLTDAGFERSIDFLLASARLGIREWC